MVTTEDYFSVSKARETGYREALSAGNLKVDESLILKLPFMDVNESAIDEFFNNQDIDAVLCVNEIFAIHCMGLVQKKGIRIPEDISFIGFTNGILSKYANPGLTSIAQHGQKMGEVAAKLLIEKVEREIEDEAEVETFRTEVLETTLIERGSTIN